MARKIALGPSNAKAGFERQEEDKQLSKMMSAWNKASPETRKTFVKWIDGPHGRLVSRKTLRAIFIVASSLGPLGSQSIVRQRPRNTLRRNSAQLSFARTNTSGSPWIPDAASASLRFNTYSLFFGNAVALTSAPEWLLGSFALCGWRRVRRRHRDSRSRTAALHARRSIPPGPWCNRATHKLFRGASWNKILRDRRFQFNYDGSSVNASNSGAVEDALRHSKCGGAE